MEYITASCVIRDNSIYRDGEIVWEYSPAGPADFLQSCYQHFGLQYPKFYKMDHLSKLGWLAAELLLSDGFDWEGQHKGGFDTAEYPPEEMAVVLSNANSSLDTDYRYFATVADIPSPALFVYTLPNIMIGEICIRHKFKGENAFFITESFDAAFIEGYVRDLLETGHARACICGWVEVFGEHYAAALFLIENKITGIPFTAGNMNRLYE
jgi:hypothetical protein